MATAVHLLFFAALFQLSDAIEVNCCGALRGCKDTKVPMLLMIFASWGIGLPVGYGFGVIGLGSLRTWRRGLLDRAYLWLDCICCPPGKKALQNGWPFSAS